MKEEGVTWDNVSELLRHRRLTLNDLPLFPSHHHPNAGFLQEIPYRFMDGRSYGFGAITKAWFEPDKRLDKLLKILTEEAKPMANLASVSDRIKAKKAAHQAKADEWATALDAMDKIEPQLLAAGDAAVAEREADIDELKANLHGLSNIATPTSPAPQPKPGAAPNGNANNA